MLTDLFRRWCGLSPKSVAQAVALNHAKKLLADQQSVLDTTSARWALLDPAAARPARHPRGHAARRVPSAPAASVALEMVWGAALSPLRHRGGADSMTEYGLERLGFADENMSVEEAFEDLANRRPTCCRYRRATTRQWRRSPPGCSTGNRWDPGAAGARFVLRFAVPIFEVQVWRRL